MWPGQNPAEGLPSYLQGLALDCCLLDRLFYSENCMTNRMHVFRVFYSQYMKDRMHVFSFVLFTIHYKPHACFQFFLFTIHYKLCTCMFSVLCIVLFRKLKLKFGDYGSLAPTQPCWVVLGAIHIHCMHGFSFMHCFIQMVKVEIWGICLAPTQPCWMVLGCCIFKPRACV